MQAYELDWTRLFDLAGEWRALPVSARRVLLQQKLKVSPPIQSISLGTDSKHLVEAGFAMRKPSNPELLILNEIYQTPLSAMRAMERFKIYDESIRLEIYLRNILTQNECAILVDKSAIDNYQAPTILAGQACSPNWLEKFHALKRPKIQKEYDLKRDGDRLEHMRMNADEILRAAQALVKNLTSRTEPVPLSEVTGLLPNTERKIVACGILEAIRHAVIFPALREGDLEPVLGIWPEITRRLNRKIAPKPEPLNARPPHPVDIPFRMEDITTLLVACAKEPLRMRADSRKLFSRASADLLEAMLTLPDWYSEFAGLVQDNEEQGDSKVPLRIERAFDLALRLKFVKCDQNDERKDVLSVTTAGMAWLAINPKERLKTLLDTIHIHVKSVTHKRRETPDFLVDYRFTSILDDADYFTQQFIWGGLIGSYWPYNWRHENHALKIKKSIADAFAALAVGSFYALDKFLIYNAEFANPLPALLQESPNGQKPSYSYSGFNLNEELLERLWSDTLLSVFWRALAPFGGVVVAELEKDKTPSFSLTSIGRYLLGLEGDFEFGFSQTSATKDALVVQPNFELVFLAPSPALEAACSRFCERAGKGRSIGTLFRITKKSIHAAAGTGLTAGAVLDTLANACAKTLPRNVEHEIKAWFAQCRHVSVRQATLIECPDAETAQKVAHSWAGKTTLLNPTVVALQSSIKKAEISKKLRALGVFVSQTNQGLERDEDDGED